MSAAAYLAADAAALGDAELPRPARCRPVSDTVLQELDYAANLFRRADKALSDELTALRGMVDVEIDWNAANDLCTKLLSMGLMFHLRAQQERARRSA